MNASLAEVLAQHQLELSADQVSLLEKYSQALWRWNEKLNLTRHTDYEKFVSRDVLDSQQLSQLLEPGEEVLDIGSGGGVPGVILAILRPDLEVSLCESVGKKAAALEAIVRELALPTPVHRARAEDVLEDLRFDVLTARAVGPLWKICTWLQPHWHSFDRLLAIKGPRWPEERGEARHRGLLNRVELRKVVSYPMPDTDSESVILKIWRPRPT